MFSQTPEVAELSEAWIESDDRARWRSASGHGAGAAAKDSGSSILEVDPDCFLPRHTDSAEEVIVVVSGAALVIVGDDSADAPEVTTTYEEPVQPGGGRER